MSQKSKIISHPDYVQPKWRTKYQWLDPMNKIDRTSVYQCKSTFLSIGTTIGFGVFNQNKFFKAMKCLCEAVDVTSVTESFTDRKEDLYVFLVKTESDLCQSNIYKCICVSERSGIGDISPRGFALCIVQLHYGTADDLWGFVLWCIVEKGAKDSKAGVSSVWHPELQSFIR